MKFYRWDHENAHWFNDCDVFMECSPNEVVELWKKTHNEEFMLYVGKPDVIDNQGTAKFYYFLNTREKTFTPMRSLAYAFGGMYGDDIPVQKELHGFRFEQEKYRLVPFCKADENSGMKRELMEKLKSDKNLNR